MASFVLKSCGGFFFCCLYTKWSGSLQLLEVEAEPCLSNSALRLLPTLTGDFASEAVAATSLPATSLPVSTGGGVLNMSGAVLLRQSRMPSSLFSFGEKCATFFIWVGTSPSPAGNPATARSWLEIWRQGIPTEATPRLPMSLPCPRSRTGLSSGLRGRSLLGESGEPGSVKIVERPSESGDADRARAEKQRMALEGDNAERDGDESPKRLALPVRELVSSSQ
mmetsp:Transcript_92316/g.214508  ORF Transcript_92316/g.214508 Transcript_92316/m.214508 type:complete len:223 (-) Transcript_92316:356-1024(-)